MSTIYIAFRRYASRHTELRTAHNTAGNPVTSKLPMPLHASRYVPLSSNRVQTGNPMTTILSISPPLEQAQLWFKNAHSGNLETAMLAFSNPLIREELLTKHGVTGSVVTTSLLFSRPLVHAVMQSAYEHAESSLTETIAFYRLPIQYTSLQWQSGRKTYSTAMVRFRNDYKNYITSLISYRFDWKTMYETVFRYRHRSLVQGGWRIVAKNLETEQSLELGFINEDDPTRTLENVVLPDGNYEISVLTSSLYWKDTRDNNIRTISIRQDEEISPLPVIHNLRSSVSLGERTILWSASVGELDECLFGIWYSSESPVDTNRPPDATVWYSSFMTEYQTSFDQNAPAYVAVAALRPGNESEKGKVHELYLHWESTPPRAPEDVIVLVEPLPVFDTAMAERNVNNDNVSIWY